MHQMMVVAASAASLCAAGVANAQAGVLSMAAQASAAQQAQAAGAPVEAPLPAANDTSAQAGAATGAAANLGVNAAQIDDGLKDIVVTGTRRAANLQKVAATIDVVSAATLDSLNIKGSDNLGQLVPGVAILRSGGVTPFIRGVGSNNTGYTAENSVAFYVDGLYLPNSSGALFSFNNVERIEVLKGPQGTLYGRNSTGGLINIITRDPGTTTVADLSVGYANYNTPSVNFYGSTPLSSTLSANVAVFSTKQYKGYGLNLFTGNDVLKSTETGVYAKILWRPSAGTRVTLSGMYDYNNNDTGIVQAILPGTRGTDGTPYLGQYRTSLRIDPSAPYHGYLASLKTEQDIGFANLTSLTGYQASHQVSSFIGNGIPGQPVAGQSASGSIITGRNSTFSQELLLASKPSDSPFDWLVGGFYYHDNSSLRSVSYVTCVGNTCAPGIPTQTLPFFPTRSTSGFGDATYRVFPGTHVTLGLRYTDETKFLNGTAIPYPGLPNSVAALPANVVTFISTSRQYSKLTYRAVLAQDLTQDIHGYVSYNRGFRSGGYSVTVYTNPPTRPEVLDSYEVGLKSELFNHRLRLNLSGFYYDYKDVQVRSTAGLPIGTAAILTNAASVHETGAEGQFDYAPFRGLSINGGFEWLDARYVSFPGATCTAPRPISAAGLGGVSSFSCDLAGAPLPIAPKLSTQIGFTYTLPTSVGSFILSTNDGYKSSYSLVTDNSVRQRALNIIGASLTWREPSKRFDVQVFVANLTDEFYYSGAQASTNYVYNVAPPRTYGIKIGYHYF